MTNATTSTPPLPITRADDASFLSLLSFMKEHGLPLCLLIDEYDRFANKILLEDPHLDVQTVAGVSKEPGSSFLRAFYEVVKQMDLEMSGVPFMSFTTGITRWR